MYRANVTIVELGTWGRAALLAEYDPEDEVIRVDRRAVARIRALLGDEEALRFVACAVAHERFHAGHPECSESEAHAAARVACGVDPAYYERLLSGAPA